jgi:hypothetical protein
VRYRRAEIECGEVLMFHVGVPVVTPIYRANIEDYFGISGRYDEIFKNALNLSREVFMLLSLMEESEKNT